MACRIGITTNLQARKAHWQSVHPTLNSWQILGGPTSKSDAQAIETKLAKQYNCEAYPGGDDPDDGSNQWYVYGFNY